MKKNLIIPACIALFVTLGTLGITRLFQSPSTNTVKIEHVNSAQAHPAVMTKIEKGNIGALDFTETSAKVLETVVHIKSTQTSELRGRNNEKPYYEKRLPDPFQDLFGDRGNDFFGPYFHFENPNEGNGPQIRIGTGSGVILNEKGYIVTNNHVVANADDIEVTLHDNRIFKAVVLGTDPATDLALIQIKAEDLPALPLVDSDEIKVGEWVLAVGNPLGLNSTVTAGIVSATGRNINILKEQFAVESFIQTDAAINPGNSGGALVNLQGGLVGINTAIASPTGSYAGYGFAIPANIVNKVIDDLLTYGSVQRGVLGVMIRSVDGNWAKEKGLDINTGAYIDTVLENSAAANAGLRSGDVIIEIDGTNIKTSPELQAEIAQHHPSDVVKVRVNRKGREEEFDVTLLSRENNTTVLKKEDRKILNILGIEVDNIDSDLAKKLEIKGGVKVTRLNPGILKLRTQIKPGFIITHVDEQEIKNIDDFIKVISKKKGGVMMEGMYENIPGAYYYAFGIDS